MDIHTEKFTWSHAHGLFHTHKHAQSVYLILSNKWLLQCWYHNGFGEPITWCVHRRSDRQYIRGRRRSRGGISQYNVSEPWDEGEIGWFSITLWVPLKARKGKIVDRCVCMCVSMCVWEGWWRGGEKDHISGFCGLVLCKLLFAN